MTFFEDLRPDTAGASPYRNGADGEAAGPYAYASANRDQHGNARGFSTVSYTHLDVYKRQGSHLPASTQRKYCSLVTSVVSMKNGVTVIRILGRSSGLPPWSLPRKNGPPGIQTMPGGASLDVYKRQAVRWSVPVPAEGAVQPRAASPPGAAWRSA